MSHPIPEDVQRLVARLRQAADEIESAARYGVPIPYSISASGHKYGGVSFSANEAEFSAWADYTEAEVEHYEHGGSEWSSADSDVNGMPLSFAVKHATAKAAS